jgi:hypothetical protein
LNIHRGGKMAKTYKISKSKIKIKDKGNKDVEYDPTFEIEVEDEYEAKEKNVPSGLPDQFNGQTVTWLNNFVVKKGAESETTQEKKVPTYKVFMKALPDAPTGPRSVCVYYGGEIHAMTLHNSGREGQVMFTLDVGDPPTGTVP